MEAQLRQRKEENLQLATTLRSALDSLTSLAEERRLLQAQVAAARDETAQLKRQHNAAELSAATCSEAGSASQQHQHTHTHASQPEVVEHAVQTTDDGLRFAEATAEVQSLRAQLSAALAAADAATADVAKLRTEVGETRGLLAAAKAAGAAATLELRSGESNATELRAQHSAAVAAADAVAADAAKLRTEENETRGLLAAAIAAEAAARLDLRAGESCASELRARHSDALAAVDAAAADAAKFRAVVDESRMLLAAAREDETAVKHELRSGEIYASELRSEVRDLRMRLEKDMHALSSAMASSATAHATRLQEARKQTAAVMMLGVLRSSSRRALASAIHAWATDCSLVAAANVRAHPQTAPDAPTPAAEIELAGAASIHYSVGLDAAVAVAAKFEPTAGRNESVFPGGMASLTVPEQQRQQQPYQHVAVAQTQSIESVGDDPVAVCSLPSTAAADVLAVHQNQNYAATAAASSSSNFASETSVTASSTANIGCIPAEPTVTTPTSTCIPTVTTPTSTFTMLVVDPAAPHVTHRSVRRAALILAGEVRKLILEAETARAEADSERLRADAALSFLAKGSTTTSAAAAAGVCSTACAASATSTVSAATPSESTHHCGSSSAGVYLPERTPIGSETSLVDRETRVVAGEARAFDSEARIVEVNDRLSEANDRLVDCEARLRAALEDAEDWRGVATKNAEAADACAGEAEAETARSAVLLSVLRRLRQTHPTLVDAAIAFVEASASAAAATLSPAVVASGTSSLSMDAIASSRESSASTSTSSAPSSPRGAHLDPAFVAATLAAISGTAISDDTEALSSGDSATAHGSSDETPPLPNSPALAADAASQRSALNLLSARLHSARFEIQAFYRRDARAAHALGSLRAQLSEARSAASASSAAQKSSAALCAMLRAQAETLRARVSQLERAISTDYAPALSATEGAAAAAETARAEVELQLALAVSARDAAFQRANALLMQVRNQAAAIAGLEATLGNSYDDALEHRARLLHRFAATCGVSISTWDHRRVAAAAGGGGPPSADSAPLSTAASSSPSTSSTPHQLQPASLFQEELAALISQLSAEHANGRDLTKRLTAAQLECTSVREAYTTASAQCSQLSAQLAAASAELRRMELAAASESEAAALKIAALVAESASNEAAAAAQVEAERANFNLRCDELRTAHASELANFNLRSEEARVNFNLRSEEVRAAHADECGRLRMQVASGLQCIAGLRASIERVTALLSKENREKARLDDSSRDDDMHTTAVASPPSAAATFSAGTEATSISSTISAPSYEALPLGSASSLIEPHTRTAAASSSTSAAAAVAAASVDGDIAPSSPAGSIDTHVLGISPLRLQYARRAEALEACHARITTLSRDLDTKHSSVLAARADALMHRARASELATLVEEAGAAALLLSRRLASMTTAGNACTGRVSALARILTPALDASSSEVEVDQGDSVVGATLCVLLTPAEAFDVVSLLLLDSGASASVSQTDPRAVQLQLQSVDRQTDPRANSSIDTVAHSVTTIQLSEAASTPATTAATAGTAAADSGALAPKGESSGSDSESSVMSLESTRSSYTTATLMRLKQQLSSALFQRSVTTDAQATSPSSQKSRSNRSSVLLGSPQPQRHHGSASLTSTTSDTAQYIASLSELQLQLESAIKEADIERSRAESMEVRTSALSASLAQCSAECMRLSEEVMTHVDAEGRLEKRIRELEDAQLQLASASQLPPQDQLDLVARGSPSPATSQVEARRSPSPDTSQVEARRSPSPDTSQVEALRSPRIATAASNAAVAAVLSDSVNNAGGRGGATNFNLSGGRGTAAPALSLTQQQLLQRGRHAMLTAAHRYAPFLRHSTASTSPAASTTIAATKATSFSAAATGAAISTSVGPSTSTHGAAFRPTFNSTSAGGSSRKSKSFSNDLLEPPPDGHSHARPSRIEETSASDGSRVEETSTSDGSRVEESSTSDGTCKEETSVSTRGKRMRMLSPSSSSCSSKPSSPAPASKLQLQHAPAPASSLSFASSDDFSRLLAGPASAVLHTSSSGGASGASESASSAGGGGDANFSAGGDDAWDAVSSVSSSSTSGVLQLAVDSSGHMSSASSISREREGRANISVGSSSSSIVVDLSRRGASTSAELSHRPRSAVDRGTSSWAAAPSNSALSPLSAESASTAALARSAFELNRPPGEAQLQLQTPSPAFASTPSLAQDHRRGGSRHMRQASLVSLDVLDLHVLTSPMSSPVGSSLGDASGGGSADVSSASGSAESRGGDRGIAREVTETAAAAPRAIGDQFSSTSTAIGQSGSTSVSSSGGGVSSPVNIEAIMATARSLLQGTGGVAPSSTSHSPSSSSPSFVAPSSSSFVATYSSSVGSAPLSTRLSTAIRPESSIVAPSSTTATSLAPMGGKLQLGDAGSSDTTISGSSSSSSTGNSGSGSGWIAPLCADDHAERVLRTLVRSVSFEEREGIVPLSTVDEEEDGGEDTGTGGSSSRDGWSPLRGESPAGSIGPMRAIRSPANTPQ